MRNAARSSTVIYDCKYVWAWKLSSWYPIQFVQWSETIETQGGTLVEVNITVNDVRIRQFVQRLVQDNAKEIVKALHYGSFVKSP